MLGIRAIVGFHGSTVVELRQDFKNAIDFMIEEACSRGIEPEQPADEDLVLHIPPELHGAALTAAHETGQSFDQWAAKVLAEASRIQDRSTEMR